MDHRLEPIDKILASFAEDHDNEMELAFAMRATVLDDPTTLRWLAAVAAARAAELD